MNTTRLIWPGIAVLAVALFGVTSCSTNNDDDITVIEAPDGVIIVDTFATTATVTAIDRANRKLTLVTADGHKTKYKCGPDVVNFSQIQVGDQVNAMLTEEAAIYIGSGSPPSDMAATGVALAPVGAKPGGVMVDTMQVTAKVVAVDTKKHKVTFQFADDTTKKVKVSKQVNLNALQPGDTITAQVSEGLAISVEK